MTRLLVVEPGYCPYQAGFPSAIAAASEVIEGESQILNGDKVIGLSKDQADRYSRLLFLPQVADMASDELPAAKVRPQDERYGGKLSFWERLER